jgi:hypothetical protein
MLTANNLEPGVDRLRVHVKQTGAAVYSVPFIESGRKVLDETHGPEAEHVPGRVVASNGSNAWTQAVFLNMEATIG